MTLASLPVWLRSLCLGERAHELERITEEAGRDGWSHEEYLRLLGDVEISRRAQRRQQRLLKDSQLPEDKTLAGLEQNRLSLRVRRQLATLLEGRFVEQAENVLAFGRPGRGKTRLCGAIAREVIVTKGYRALFVKTVHLAQQLRVAQRALRLEAVLRKLDGESYQMQQAKTEKQKEDHSPCDAPPPGLCLRPCPCGHARQARLLQFQNQTR